MEKPDAASAVKQAQDAVKDLQEPYKMEAFKLILDRLMSGVASVAEVKKSSVGKPKKKSAGAINSSPKKSKPESSLPTTLDLSVEQLKKLHAYFERFTVKGGEVCAFVIANFIREELKRETFTSADIEYCYRRLISMKVAAPNIKDVERALSWLAAPSRQKEWLKKAEHGRYQVSNSGLLAFNKLEQVKSPR